MIDDCYRLVFLLHITKLFYTFDNKLSQFLCQICKLTVSVLDFFIYSKIRLLGFCREDGNHMAYNYSKNIEDLMYGFVIYRLQLYDCSF